jgi:hypothetical protein
MRIINCNSKFVHKDMEVCGKMFVIAFEPPINVTYWYRVFKKPTGRCIALKDMSEALPGWEFVGSLNIYESGQLNRIF